MSRADQIVTLMAERLEWQIVYGLDFWEISEDERLVRVLTSKLERWLEDQERLSFLKTLRGVI